MFQDILNDDAVGHVEGETLCDEVLEAVGDVVASELQLLGLMDFHVHVVVEWKVSAHHVVKNDAERPDCEWTRVEAVVEQILRRLVQIRAAECAHGPSGLVLTLAVVQVVVVGQTGVDDLSGAEIDDLDLLRNWID